MASSVPRLLLLLCPWITLCSSQSSYDYTEKDDEPPLWVDVTFLVFIVCIHTIYAAKVMDYSLAHLSVHSHTPSESKYQGDRGRATAAKGANSSNPLSSPPPNAEPLHEQTSLATKAGIKFKGLQHFTTKSDHRTKSRGMKSPSFLCCIRCSPSLFTWDRTDYFRQMLRSFPFTLRLCEDVQDVRATPHSLKWSKK